MANVDVARPRAPRGTKILTQAFFAALSDIPQPQQEAVGKAALAAIKEQLQIKRPKGKVCGSPVPRIWKIKAGEVVIEGRRREAGPVTRPGSHLGLRYGCLA